MITDKIITVLYQLLGALVDTLPSAAAAPSWVSSSFSTLASLDPLFPVAKFATFLGVYAGLLLLFYGWRVLRFILSK